MLAKMDSRPGESGYERLEEAERASYRARDLTQQLLTFSLGGAPIKRTLALGGLIRDAATFSLRGSHSRCEMVFPENLHPVEADEGQMGQVINNLVINAVQAMPEGGTVRISCENAQLGADSGMPLPPGDYVKVSVTDRGVGIPAENLKKIFDPYFTTKEKGSGLGLATSYSIIKRHNGHISVESQPGTGTTFSFFLPASTADLLQETVVEHRSIRGTGRVLVVDDEAMIRDVAAKILVSQGYEVESAADGQMALVHYVKAQQQGKPFDVVILDLTIPGGLGGKETIKKLLEIDPQAKAIVSSGYSNDPIMAQFGEYGFKGVAAKPYSIKILSQAVHDAMQDSREP
jgi:CheY-like chemotaxis protein